MTYPKRTKVTFTVQGESDGRGNVAVGCKFTTEEEILQYARSYDVGRAHKARLPGR